LYDIIEGLEERIRTLETSRRLGSASVDSGELTVRGGDIVVRNSSGDAVLRILSGNSPEIQMTPAGNVAQDYQLATYAWESEGQGAALQLSVERLTPTPVQSGGKLLLMAGGTYLSHQPEASTESFYSAGAFGDGILVMKGKFRNGVSSMGDEAVVCGSTSVAAGVSTYTFTYPVPMTTAPAVVYGILNTAGIVDHALTAQTTTSFTVVWSGTLAKVINFWAFRI
jgi:hypothetical protein